MNGARSTYMRKGYLLTALAAAVLLAASSGTAYAQLTGTAVTLEVPPRVTEGNDIIVTVRGTAMVDATTPTATRVEVVVAFDGSGEAGVTAEFTQPSQVDDATIVSNPTATLTFAANSGGEPRMRTASATVTVRTNHDGDAENEAVVVTGTSAGDSDITDVSFTIVDDETQTYALSLAPIHTASNPPKENSPVMVRIAAKPPHYDDMETLTLNVVQDGKRPSGYTAAGPGNDGPWVVNIGAGAADNTPAEAADNTREITITPPEKRQKPGNRHDYPGSPFWPGGE